MISILFPTEFLVLNLGEYLKSIGYVIKDIDGQLTVVKEVK